MTTETEMFKLHTSSDSLSENHHSECFCSEADVVRALGALGLFLSRTLILCAALHEPELL